jgi:hypothetical protein
MPFEGWLFQTLASHVGIYRSSIADWSMTGCDDPQSPVPGAGADFCIEAVVPLTASRRVHFIFVAGEAVRVRGGTLRWRRTTPFLREVFIASRGEGPDDSLDVPSLHELESMLQLPRDQWPTVDLQPSISLAPAVPVAGEPVQLTIEVTNKGKRSLDRARVEVVIGWCCPQEEIRKDWFPRISAGHSVRMTVALPTPDPSMLAVASARPGPSMKRVRESTPDRSTAYAGIGQRR